MKALGIGFAAVLAFTTMATSAFAAAKTDIPAPARAAGMAAAPTLIQTTHLRCELADAWKFGESSAGGGKQTFYEIACKDAIGYVVITDTKKPVPDYVDCLEADAPQNGKPSNIACKLPGNANPAAGLQSVVAASGHTCPVDKARYVGGNDKMDVFEVTCQGVGGYMLTQQKADGKTTAQLCADFGTGSNIKCELETQAQQDAAVDALASATPKPCQVTNRRWVGAMPDGSADFYEVACSDKSGYVLQVDQTGKVAQAIDCIKAAGYAGGCTLTDTRQAETEQNGVYTDLAKKAGFDCQVSKYADLPSDVADTEVVELACSNRQDGGVGFFPAKGTPKVLNCLRAGAEGHTCSYSSIKPLLPKLSAGLAAKGKGSCVVSDARPIGATNSGTDFIEVACADGGPGWVMQMPAGQDTPSDLLNCVQAETQIAKGACQLATNKPKGA